MASTTGFVQRMTLLPGNQACVWIGPAPTTNDLLVVTNNGSTTDVALSGSLIDSLGSAMMQRREVVAFHGSSNSKITSLRIDPV